MPFWVRVRCATTTSRRSIDTLRRLELDDTIRMVPQILNTVIFAAVLTQAQRLVGRRRPDPRAR